MDEPSKYAVGPRVERREGREGELIVHLACDGAQGISETVIYPFMPSQGRGIEDVRLVEFTDDDGARDYCATYTAFNGAEVRQALLRTNDFKTFEARGATNINDGIFAAAEYLLKQPPNGRRVIILISDDVGTDAGGQGTRDIVTEAIASDAVLYNLKIPGYNPPATIFASSMIPGLVNIRKVMDATGGEEFDVKDVANLDTVFSALIQRIKTRYTLGYYTMANGAGGKPHKLDVRLTSSFGKKGRDYNILAKNGYYVR